MYLFKRFILFHIAFFPLFLYIYLHKVKIPITQANSSISMNITRFKQIESISRLPVVQNTVLFSGVTASFMIDIALFFFFFSGRWYMIPLVVVTILILSYKLFMVKQFISFHIKVMMFLIIFNTFEPSRAGTGWSSNWRDWVFFSTDNMTIIIIVVVVWSVLFSLWWSPWWHCCRIESLSFEEILFLLLLLGSIW